MLTQQLIKDAGALRKQIQKGTIVLPAIESFLAKVEGSSSALVKNNKKVDRRAKYAAKIHS